MIKYVRGIDKIEVTWLKRSFDKAPHSVVYINSQLVWKNEDIDKPFIAINFFIEIIPGH